MLFAVSTLASERNVKNSKKLYTDTYSSKQEAINAGFNMYDTLMDASEKQLLRKLNPIAYNVIERSMYVENVQVGIEEVPVSREAIYYRSVVYVDYSYKVREHSGR